MSLLTESATDNFLNRFYSFADSVLRKIEISYSQGGERSVSISIASRDAQQPDNGGWACVQLVVHAVQDFCFADASNTTAQVLSNGIHVCWFRGAVGIDFGHFIDSPIDRNDLLSSKFFAIGATATWTVGPYDGSGEEVS
jgi:hypothetical protein